MNKIFTHALVAVLGASALPASATSKLEEIIVTSSRVAMPLREVATAISVVTEQDIQVRGFASVADVLRYEPAVSVSNSGGAGKATSVSIRGERGYRTKVFIDGIDVTDTSTPQAGPNFANVVSAGVQRIEILRGPQGMMYGADAGGVVSISTLQAEPGLQGGANGEFGRYGTTQYAGHLSGGSELGDFSVIAAKFETDGFNSLTTDTVLRDDDGYENTTFHGRVGWNITDTLRAEAVGRQVEGDDEYDNCSDVITFARTDNCTGDYDQDAWRGALVHQGEVFGNTLSYGENTSKRKFYSDGQRSYATQGELQKIEYLGSYKPAEQLALVYGVDLQNESIDDGSLDTDRDQQGYYLEYQGNFSDSLYLTGGARYDDNDDFGSQTTYRVSAAYLLDFAAGELKFKATYGTGFRAPSLSEIAYNDGPFAYPPASETDLDAEESEGYDLGVGYYADNGWYIDAVYFDQQIDDEIYFDLVGFSGYLQGSGASTSKGVELTSEVPIAGTLLFSGNYTYNDTEDADGEQRLRAPEHMANLGIKFSPWDARLVVNLNLRLARDFPAELGGDIDDYEVLDLSVSYQVFDAMEIYGRIENLTDENYQEVPTYNTAGAAGFAGLRFSF